MNCLNHVYNMETLPVFWVPSGFPLTLHTYTYCDICTDAFNLPSQQKILFITGTFKHLQIIYIHRSHTLYSAHWKGSKESKVKTPG